MEFLLQNLDSLEKEVIKLQKFLPLNSSCHLSLSANGIFHTFSTKSYLEQSLICESGTVPVALIFNK